MDLMDGCVEKNIYKLGQMLGENKYLDRFIVDEILKCKNKLGKKVLEKIMRELVSKANLNKEALYHIMDMAMESKIDLFSEKDLISIFNKCKLDFDIISLLLDYIGFFKKDISEIPYEEFLEKTYPEMIRLQGLSLIFDLYGRKKAESLAEKYKLVDDKNKGFYGSYFDFLQGHYGFEKTGLLLLQSMFYGDFEHSGKGNNGGLAILLKTLGGEVAKDDRVGQVFTLALARNLDKAFISHYGAKHVFIRLPLYIDENSCDPFIKKELSIKRSIKTFLEKIDLCPDIFHIRYLDNASRAVAKLTDELDKKLVLTLAPDPHRNIFTDNNDENKFKLNKIIQNMNKIKIGDELIYKVHAILGIGNEKAKKEIEIYFPQFKEKEIKKKIKMIGEGIYTNIAYEDIDLHDFVKENKIHKDFFKKPTILNVGRISHQKGQIKLLKAWEKSKLAQSHNLLIIGGDLENPSLEEKEIIDFFQSYVKLRPHIKNQFFHKGAMANEQVRSLEKSIIKNKFSYPHIYLCSSLKEEFGIAILEAMSQEFLVFGPKEGGVRSYVSNGINGFLIDTKSQASIARDMEKYLYDEKMTLSDFRKIQKAGRKTIENRFSMEKIGNEFLLFYLGLKGEKSHES